MTPARRVRRASPRRPRGFPVEQVLDRLIAEAEGWAAPVVTFIAQAEDDPFQVLVSCLLSLRTRDETTNAASQRLFARADTPAALLALPEAELARLIYPVGFYKTKARTLRAVAAALLERHAGAVPRDEAALLALPGVGRKTANLVLSQAFGVPAICVDTHVHRIPNRWGLVRTRTPEESEAALRRVVPERYWVPLNPTLVAFGQTLCHPTSPRCSQCPVAASCARVGVTRSR
ncbi:MAG: endonuclease III [Planctomycetes bacterium]|nr:endonuclease III [Planctomycetota bacterium]